MSIVTPGGFRIEGCWTKAGIGSCVHISGKRKNCDILFDCGVFEESTSSASYVFVSHSHTDHIGAVIAHARARALSRNPAKYYVPHFAVEQLESARKAFSFLDDRDISMEIIGVAPGDIIYCDGNYKVVVFGTEHRVPSQGYALYTQASKKLKSEYFGISSDEIKALIVSGVEVHEEKAETLDIVYTGDTVMKGLLTEANRFLFSAAIFITELTYLDGPYERAIEWGHIHINDIVEHHDIFVHVQQLIFVHISVRYSPYSKILEMMHQSLPEAILSKSLVSLKTFGASEHLSNPMVLNRREVGWGWGRPQSRDTHHSNAHHSSNQQSQAGRGDGHRGESGASSIGRSWSAVVGRGSTTTSTSRGRSHDNGGRRGRGSHHSSGRGRGEAPS